MCLTVIDEDEMNNLKPIRGSGCSEKGLFLNYRQGRCTVQECGKNKFEKIPFIIAKYLCLADPDKYTRLRQTR